MLIANQWMFLYFVIGLALSGYNCVSRVVTPPIIALMPPEAAVPELYLQSLPDFDFLPGCVQATNGHRRADPFLAGDRVVVAVWRSGTGLNTN